MSVIVLQFESWSCNGSRPEIILLVPAGQLHIGKALITAIYDQIPADLSQQQLLQLLVLAESYRISKISTAVVQAISSIGLEQLDWETVLAMEQLPAAEPLYSPLIAPAEARRMQLLGDLEMVWALESEQQRQFLRKQLKPGAAAAETRAKALMKSTRIDGDRYPGCDLMSYRRGKPQLPEAVRAVEQAAAAAAHSTVLPHVLLLQLSFDRLVELLSSDDIKAESDNTVYYTITRWLEQHPEVTSTEQLQRLASLVHLSRCTPNYLTMCVCTDSSWLLPLLPARKVAHLAVASARRTQKQSLLRCDRQLTDNGYDPRLASALQKLEIKWCPPLSDIHQMVDASLQDPDNATDLVQPHAFRWQGIDFSLSLGVIIQDEMEMEDDGPLIHCLYARLEADGDAVAFAGSITAWEPKATPYSPPEVYVRQEQPPQESGSRTRTYLLLDRFCADGEESEPHAVVETIGHTWEDLEGHLRRRGLVSHDNRLHLTAMVTKVI